MALNEGIHAIPISNSSAKCLMENWVEERAAKPLDTQQLSLDKQKRGHRGIITLKEEDKIEVHMRVYLQMCFFGVSFPRGIDGYQSQM